MRPLSISSQMSLQEFPLTDDKKNHELTVKYNQCSFG